MCKLILALCFLLSGFVLRYENSNSRDDRPVAQTLQLLFSSYNYTVDLAVDGEAGLEMAEAFEYDLLLLDVVLPKLDGISLCQYLRAGGL
ncbi:response regulator [Leptodesmis sp.]|uniref:response regulator n=1 Tax=Leptodesmis sp. TaxID=3100501 RepID=UPI0040535399